MLDPRGLHWVHRFWRSQPLDGGDLAADIADLERAGPDRHAVDVYRAGAAHCDSAAIFRTRYSKLVSQDPKQGHVVFDIHLVRPTVDFQAHGTRELFDFVSTLLGNNPPDHNVARARGAPPASFDRLLMLEVVGQGWANVARPAPQSDRLEQPAQIGSHASVLMRKAISVAKQGLFGKQDGKQSRP
jgi:hypothetical protein